MYERPLTRYHAASSLHEFGPPFVVRCCENRRYTMRITTPIDADSHSAGYSYPPWLSCKQLRTKDNRRMTSLSDENTRHVRIFSPKDQREAQREAVRSRSPVRLHQTTLSPSTPIAETSHLPAGPCSFGSLYSPSAGSEVRGVGFGIKVSTSPLMSLC